MRILIVTPAPPNSLKGNRVTANRWERLLRELGHEVEIQEEYQEAYQHREYDLLLALHARKSAQSIRQFHQSYPDSPIVLALTGTDLYRDIQHHASAQQSLEIAWQYLLLQPDGLNYLPESLRDRGFVVYQSVSEIPAKQLPLENVFEVCVMGHLREVKDPFRTAIAARDLPDSSKIKITHLGGALSQEMEDFAEKEQAMNSRYQWLGEVSRDEALRILSRSSLLSLTSILEGGANVISEAIAVGTPVISSRISGSIGLLGEDYPGYFEVKNTQQLTDLLHRVETDLPFYQSLQTKCQERTFIVSPDKERESLKELLESLKL